MNNDIIRTEISRGITNSIPWNIRLTNIGVYEIAVRFHRETSFALNVTGGNTSEISYMNEIKLITRDFDGIKSISRCVPPLDDSGQSDVLFNEPSEGFSDIVLIIPVGISDINAVIDVEETNKRFTPNNNKITPQQIQLINNFIRRNPKAKIYTLEVVENILNEICNMPEICEGTYEGFRYRICRNRLTTYTVGTIFPNEEYIRRFNRFTKVHGLLKKNFENPIFNGLKNITQVMMFDTPLATTQQLTFRNKTEFTESIDEGVKLGKDLIDYFINKLSMLENED